MLDTRLPFTLREAVAAGVPAYALRSRRFKQVLRGIYVSREVVVTDEVMCRAALKAVPDPSAHVSHVSAARLHGLPVPELPDEHVTVTTAAARRRRRGVVCHVGPPGAVTTRRGLRVSSPERVFAELAALVSLVDLVVVGDHVVRRELCTVERLRAAASNSPLPGRVRAKEAADLVRERVDSPVETRLRLLLRFAGLPEPVTNYEVRDARGLLLRRHDLALPEQRLAFEVQGRHHVEAQQTWESDIDRLEESNAEDWRTVQVPGRATYQAPGRVLRTAWRAMRQCGAPGVPADFGQLSDLWRQHFRSD